MTNGPMTQVPIVRELDAGLEGSVGIVQVWADGEISGSIVESDILCQIMENHNGAFKFSLEENSLKEDGSSEVEVKKEDQQTSNEHPSFLTLRWNAWLEASTLIESLIEKHGLESYVIGGSVVGGGSTMTKMDQHLDHIERVARWLLGEEEK